MVETAMSPSDVQNSLITPTSGVQNIGSGLHAFSQQERAQDPFRDELEFAVGSINSQEIMGQDKDRRPNFLKNSGRFRSTSPQKDKDEPEVSTREHVIDEEKADERESKGLNLDNNPPIFEDGYR